jgi:regulator of RNase E activity RraB
VTDKPGKLTVDDWDSYECEINQRPVMIFVNLSAIRWAPLPDEPWLLWILARVPTAGSASGCAQSPFPELQNRVVAALADGHSRQFVGSIDSGASRELFFYSMSTEGVEHGLEQARSAFPNCVINCRSERDSRWRKYREVLYPGAIEMQRIRNRRVLGQLELRGDEHSVQRPVDHDLYFRNDLDSADFIRAAAKNGFQARFTRRLLDSGRRTRPFLVSVVRSDPVTADHISDITLELLMLAIRFDGEYDGWSCDVSTTASESTLPGHFGSNTRPRWSVRDASKEGSDSGDLH